MDFLSDKAFRWFLIRFLLIFFTVYFGTQAMIGLTAPGGTYSPFLAKYFDYVTWLRVSLLQGSKILLSAFDINTYTTADFRIRYVDGRGVYLAFDCLGYGVMSFWLALVTAMHDKIWHKVKWLFLGLFSLWFINVCRISIFLVVTNKNTEMPLGIDHHTWFNIFAYIAIFLLLFFYYRSMEKADKGNKPEQPAQTGTTETTHT